MKRIRNRKNIQVSIKNRSNNSYKIITVSFKTISLGFNKYLKVLTLNSDKIAPFVRIVDDYHNLTYQISRYISRPVTGHDYINGYPKELIDELNMKFPSDQKDFIKLMSFK